MPQPQPNNPLHGVTLKAILESLVTQYGWQRLGDQINIQCFVHQPSISSSLKFLRKTPWARTKVERLYLDSIDDDSIGHSSLDTELPQDSRSHDSRSQDSPNQDSPNQDSPNQDSPVQFTGDPADPTESVWDRARRRKCDDGLA